MKSWTRASWWAMALEAVELQSVTPSHLSSGVLLPFILSLVGGSTDTVGFLGLNGLFTAHITGNLVVLAARVVAGDPAVLAYLLSVPVFILVLLLTSLLAERFERSGIKPLRPLMSLEVLLLLAFFLLCVTSHAPFALDSARALATGMCGVAAMAVQTALVQICLADAPSTAAMTTNVTQFVFSVAELVCRRDGSEAEQARKRISRTLPVIIGFVLGSALGAAGDAAWGLWSLSVPTALSLLALVLSLPLAGTK